VTAAGHVHEGTNATVLVHDGKPASVKADALITVVITSSTCC